MFSKNVLLHWFRNNLTVNCSTVNKMIMIKKKKKTETDLRYKNFIFSSESLR